MKTQPLFGDTIVRTFFRFQYELKLYHWQTHSYARHKASDKLGQQIYELIDTFVETYMGRYGKRIEWAQKPITIRSSTDSSIVKILHQFQKFLVNLDNLLPQSGSKSDLLNIRDELLGRINQGLYLFTLQ